MDQYAGETTRASFTRPWSRTGSDSFRKTKEEALYRDTSSRVDSPNNDRPPDVSPSDAARRGSEDVLGRVLRKLSNRLSPLDDNNDFITCKRGHGRSASASSSAAEANERASARVRDGDMCEDNDSPMEALPCWGLFRTSMTVAMSPPELSAI